MRKLKLTLWFTLALILALWLLAQPAAVYAAFFTREPLMQLTGVLAMACMSLGLGLALRPRRSERWLGGLDKMYRLHKWLGIGALVFSVLHWLAKKVPHGPRGDAGESSVSSLESLFLSLKHSAEDLGDPALYALLFMIALALLRFFPYRWFYKTHRIIVIIYLVLIYHTVVLLDFSAWFEPVGWLLALLMLVGIYGAITSLMGEVGARRQVMGKIAKLQSYPGVKSIEITVDVPQGWPGHQPGQFLFALSNASEGPHPYTIASAWHPGCTQLSCVVRELGDHTRSLSRTLQVGQPVRIEGPYGRFIFDDKCPVQIWIGAGIGITPFLARMKHLALFKDTPDWPAGQRIHLFHTTRDVDEEALRKIAADGQAAQIDLHILIDQRDGRLTGDRIRELVPDWQQASIWFCGPSRFGRAIREDFAAHEFPADRRFHQELFEMR